MENTRKIKLIIEYDGTNYCGWQVQKKGISIQETIEKALFELVEEKITIFASGRTDAGVHAFGQVAHFITHDTKSSMGKYVFGLNRLLPCDIRVQAAELVADDFHARLSAKSKMYEYKFYVSEVERPLLMGHSAHITHMLDITKMKQAMELFVGKHNFKSFCSANSGRVDFVREIFSINMIENSPCEYSIFVSANGFLYNMVRIIVGTLFEVGHNKILPKDITKIIDAQDRTFAGKTAPACGLYLKKVDYGEKS